MPGVRRKYDRLLKHVTAKFGNQETSDDELRQMAKHYKLGNIEIGSRKILMEQKGPEMEGEGEGGKPKDKGRIIKQAILNTSFHPPGVHWHAVKDGYVYDPLGDDLSGSAEQPKSDDDCGQRCIAYLLLCKQLGGSVRM